VAIASVTEFKTHLGLSGTASDSLYQTYLNQAAAIITRKTGLVFDSASATEFYQGTGTNQLVLRRRPVTAVASVYVDDSAYFGFASGAFGSSTLLTSGEDFALDITADSFSRSGILYRIGSVWPALRIRNGSELIGGEVPGLGNIKVTYTAGYSSTPDDLKLAGILLARVIMLSSSNGGQMVASESLEYYSYSLKGNADAANDMHSVQAIVNGYREFNWC
jgi:hypothetical protein